VAKLGDQAEEAEEAIRHQHLQAHLLFALYSHHLQANLQAQIQVPMVVNFLLELAAKNNHSVESIVDTMACWEVPVADLQIVVWPAVAAPPQATAGG
jgi:hypothetical protein